jgi:hypothetical protein
VTVPEKSVEVVTALDDPEAFAALPAVDRIHLLWWIRDVLERGRGEGRANSYGLKHIYQRTTGVYVTNGVFKGAMRAAGYAPVDPGEQNWCFRYRAKWRILLNQRPRRAA